MSSFKQAHSVPVGTIGQLDHDAYGKSWFLKKGDVVFCFRRRNVPTSFGYNRETLFLSAHGVVSLWFERIVTLS